MAKKGAGCLIGIILAIIAIVLIYLFISGEIFGKPGMIESISKMLNCQ